MQIYTDIMGLVVNAYPSSAKCALIAAGGYVPVIANALIGKCFSVKLNLFRLWPIIMERSAESLCVRLSGAS